MSSNNVRKMAVVTGASSGIGAIYADRLAKRGYDLLLVARRRDRLEAVAEATTRTTGASVDILQADLSAEADLVHLEAVLADDERIDLLVNNAGLGQMSTFASTSKQALADLVALNVTAPMRLAHAVLPAFMQRQRGTLVNIASVLAIHTIPTTGVYSGSKGFLMNFSRSLQQELSGTGVRVQLVLPATTATEMWGNVGVPIERMNPASVMTTEHLVDAALAGLDAGEDVTWPSVEDLNLWKAYDTAREALFRATQVGQPASRYRLD